MEIVSEPMEWAIRQWGSSDFGDVRLAKRAVKVGAAMLSRSDAGIPSQMGCWANLKAAYRLLNSASVTHESVSLGHWKSVRERARLPNQGAVLLVQDGTELDFTKMKAGSKLGSLGKGLGRGIMAHSALCVVPSDKPEVVGLALQTVWTRDHVPYAETETSSDREKRRTEFDVWEETLEAIGPAPESSSGTHWVSVGDRGSDVLAYMLRARDLGWHSLVRCRHNRSLKPEEPEEERLLFPRIRKIAPMASTRIHLRSRPGKKARDVDLNVSWALLKLSPTRKGKSPLQTTCVRVWEEPGGSKEPLEWILLTSLPVRNEEEALRVVGYYKLRWLVEEYHKCLKTGCRMEDRQLKSRNGLLALLGFLSIVATHLLQFKNPPATRPSPSEIAELVRALTGAQEDLNDPKALQRRIAMLGGFIGRKSDGDPGWQTLWNGWNRIFDIYLGFQIAQGKTYG